MKKVIFVLILAAFAVSISAQSFFRPVPKNLFTADQSAAKDLKSGLWLIRPAIAVTAVQLNWNKTLKQFDASAFNQAGLGVGYQHFIDNNGEVYNNYGFNAILLLGATDLQPSMSVALTGSFFNYINVGGLYNFTLKSFGILTGVQLKF
jgi:hypothetical protein